MGGNRAVWMDRLFIVGSPLLLLALWQLSVMAGLVDRRFFSSPGEIGTTLLRMLRDGTLLHHVGTSLARVAGGFVLGVVPGILIGALIGLSRTARAIVAPVVAVIFPIPKIAILPLLLLIFGLGEVSKLALIALGSVFLTLLNTASGVRNLPPIYRDVAGSFGASPAQYAWMVALPGALPHIFTGLKLSLQTALLLIVAAEFVGAEQGIGYLIWSSWEVFAIDQMFVGLLVLSLLGYLASNGLDAVESRLLPWRKA